VRNASSVLALVVALLALAALGAAGYAAYDLPELSWLEAALVVPVVAVLALLSLSLSTRGLRVYQSSLGRAGGEGVARAGRTLGLLALLLAVTASLALGVFAVLAATDGLSRAPW
jgi:hypothetical protein